MKDILDILVHRLLSDDGKRATALHVTLGLSFVREKKGWGGVIWVPTIFLRDHDFFPVLVYLTEFRRDLQVFIGAVHLGPALVNVL